MHFQNFYFHNSVRTFKFAYPAVSYYIMKKQVQFKLKNKIKAKKSDKVVCGSHYKQACFIKWLCRRSLQNKALKLTLRKPFEFYKLENNNINQDFFLCQFSIFFDERIQQDWHPKRTFSRTSRFLFYCFRIRNLRMGWVIPLVRYQQQNRTM